MKKKSISDVQKYSNPPLPMYSFVRILQTLSHIRLLARALAVLMKVSAWAAEFFQNPAAQADTLESDADVHVIVALPAALLTAEQAVHLWVALL